MLVEDDKSLREIYGVRLLAEGYEITSAGDGEEALAMAVKEHPDLIISDVMMPKISGFDMLDILRATPETKDIKVIVMTALSSEDQRTRGEALGANRYLVKSQVGIEDVVRTVHDVLADNAQAPIPAVQKFGTPAAPSAVPTPMPTPTIVLTPPPVIPIIPIAPMTTNQFAMPTPDKPADTPITELSPNLTTPAVVTTQSFSMAPPTQIQVEAQPVAVSEPIETQPPIETVEPVQAPEPVEVLDSPEPFIPSEITESENALESIEQNEPEEMLAPIEEPSQDFSMPTPTDAPAVESDSTFQMPTPTPVAEFAPAQDSEHTEEQPKVEIITIPEAPAVAQETTPQMPNYDITPQQPSAFAVPAQPEEPTSVEMPQPTAPFSSPAPASLGDHSIYSARPTVPLPDVDIATRMEQELRNHQLQNSQPNNDNSVAI